MKNFNKLFLGLTFLLVSACTEEKQETTATSVLELARSSDGSIQVVARNFPATSMAAQFEVVVESDDTFVVGETGAVSDLALDSIKAAAAGVNRTRVFVGDKRGLKLKQNGTIAKFRLQRTADGQASARVKLEAIKVADATGNLVQVESGPSILVD